MDIDLLKINSVHILFVVLSYFIIATLFTEVASYRAYFSLVMFVAFPFVVLLSSINIGSRAILIANLSTGFGLACLLFLIYMLTMIVAYVDDSRVVFSVSMQYFFMSTGGVLAILILLANLKNTDKERKAITFFVITLSIVSLYKIYITRDLIILSGDDVDVVTNWALIPAGLFPFVFYMKSLRTRLFLLIVVLVAIILGNKRSGMIAVILSVAMIGLYILLFKRKLIRLRYVFMLLTIFFLIFLSYYFYSDLYLNSYLRIVNISEDGGSGRIGILLEIKDFVSFTSWESLAFGGGANYYKVGVNPNYSSPHNDLIAMFLSYGIFGIMFYFFVLMRLIYFVFKNVKKRSELAVFSISLLCMFIVMSNVSGVFTYYTNYFAFFVGFAILELNNKNRVSYMNVQIFDSVSKSMLRK